MGPVNRHRGLAGDELRRRFRQARDAAHAEDVLPPGDAERELLDEPDDRHDPPRDTIDRGQLLLSLLGESIGHAARRPTIGDRFPRARGSWSSAPPSGRATPRASEELEEALSAHLGRISERGGDPGAFGDELLRINGGTRGIAEVIERFAASPGPVLTSFLFAPFWVRPLASFRAPSGDLAATTAALVEHLFVVHPVPEVLLQPWLAEPSPDLKWVSWLILFGQGGSLRRAARRFGWTVGKRFAHRFASAPRDLTPTEACMRAEIARLGGGPVELDRLRRNPAFVLDPTEEARETASERPWCAGRSARGYAFWRETVAWLVRWRGALDDERCAEILAWAVHEHTERLRGGAPGGFSWRGRRPESAGEAARAYERVRAAPPEELSWASHGLDWVGEAADAGWSVAELTTAGALAAEGRVMSHCVADRARDCARGTTVVLSLRVEGTPRLTVELDPISRRIVQARGVCNRPATEEEAAVLSRWLRARVRPPSGVGVGRRPGRG